jgi:hypothetical protein
MSEFCMVCHAEVGLGWAGFGEARRGGKAQRREMETVKPVFTGTMPLLLHADNIEWSDKMEAWRKNPTNKGISRAGDDRTPAWRWIGNLTYDDQKDIIAIPSEYIMRSLMGGGAQVPTGKGQKTFKAQSQSGILCQEMFWPLLVNGKTIGMGAIRELLQVDEFPSQLERVKKLGFNLFVKRARIGTQKHIRVRPRFDNWSISGEIILTDKQITPEILRQIADIAGRTQGLGDWRPGAKTPGPFGMFTVKL